MPTTTTTTRKRTQASRHHQSVVALFSTPDADRDEEIAKLEEQLKVLKQEKELQALQEEGSTTGPTTQSPSAVSTVKEEEEEEVPIEMFLSEGWKESEVKDPSEGGGILTNIIGVGVLVLFLALFSQVPIGQEDLSKYSAIKAPTEQIDLGDLNRARSSNDL